MKLIKCFRTFAMQKTLQDIISPWTSRTVITENILKGISEKSVIFLKGPKGAGKSELLQNLIIQQKWQFAKWIDFSQCFPNDPFQFFSNELKKDWNVSPYLLSCKYKIQLSINYSILNLALKKKAETEENVRLLQEAEKAIAKMAVSAKEHENPYLIVFNSFEKIDHSKTRFWFDWISLFQNMIARHPNMKLLIIADNFYELQKNLTENNQSFMNIDIDYLNFNKLTNDLIAQDYNPKIIQMMLDYFGSEINPYKLILPSLEEFIP